MTLQKNLIRAGPSLFVGGSMFYCLQVKNKSTFNMLLSNLICFSPLSSGFIYIYKNHRFGSLCVFYVLHYNTLTKMYYEHFKRKSIHSFKWCNHPL